MQGSAPPVSKRSSSSSFPPPKRMKTKLENPPQFYEIVDLADDDEDDEFLLTPISKQGSTKKNAICVEQCSDDDGDLNSAIMASLNSSKGSNFIDLSHDYLFLDDDIRLLSFKPVSTSFGKRRKPNLEGSVTGIASSSNTQNDPDAFCEICVEPMKKNQFFSIQGCTHAYCTDCMVKYVASKLQENITNIRCPVPRCVGLLEPEHCRSILPQEVFDRWGDALCESMILGSQKFYCPFKDCSAMLIDDGETVVRESECPNCRRMFCAQCKVAWHKGIGCEEFQKLHKDERETDYIMLMNLAKSKKWMRCPSCRVYVEKTQGCSHMKCRCGNSFCYTCGSNNIGVHNCRAAMQTGTLGMTQEARRMQEIRRMQEASIRMQEARRMREVRKQEARRMREVRMQVATRMREVRMQEATRMREVRRQEARMRQVRMQEARRMQKID